MGLFDLYKAQAYANGRADAGSIGYLEPLVTLGSGAVAEPIAGLGGLMTGDVGVINALRAGLTYQPRTQQGQAGLNAIANALQSAKTMVDENPPINALAKVLSQATDYVGERSPAAGAAMKAAPLAALALLGPGSTVTRQAIGNVGRDTAGGVNRLAQLAHQNASAVPAVRGPLAAQKGVIDLTGLPNRGRDLIRSSTDDFAKKLNDLGFKAKVQHSGSAAGPSSYVEVFDPQTGRSLSGPIRFSGHAKGAFNSQFVRDVNDIPADTARYIDEALQMRAQGPSEGMLTIQRQATEAQAKTDAYWNAVLERANAKMAANVPLSNSERQALFRANKARMSDSN